jgi:hypothetical protein
MAPRAWLEKVEDYPSHRTGVPYECLVRSVEKLSGPDRIKVELEHLDDAQLGRPLTVCFDRPIRRAGPAARFFRACGLEISTNTKFPPKDAIGKIVLVRFERDRDGQLCPVRFDPVTEETTRDAT